MWHPPVLKLIKEIFFLGGGGLVVGKFDCAKEITEVSLPPLCAWKNNSFHQRSNGEVVRFSLGAL